MKYCIKYTHEDEHGHTQDVWRICSYPFEAFIWLQPVLVVALRIFCCHERASLVAWGCALRCSAACGILVPRPGIKPACPALEGRFLTTAPPGKSPVELVLKPSPKNGLGAH